MVKCTLLKMSTRASDSLSKRYHRGHHPFRALFAPFHCSLVPLPSSQIPLKWFISEEVGTWSALRSPRVLELFGVVREGPYVFLLMDYKSGKLSQFFLSRRRFDIVGWDVRYQVHIQ